MRSSILLSFLFFVFALSSNVTARTFVVKEIGIMSISSAITPATLDYLEQQFEKMPPNSLGLIEINTPGGLVSTTKEIITLIGKQTFPITVWITPEGASASSAGAIIAAAAHFIFMSPGTNIGAATPVGLGEDIKENDARKKALNDLSALVRSLSDSRGRPSAPFEQMIQQAGSYTDKESLQLKIIDGIASNHQELAQMLVGKIFNMQGETYNLEIDSNLKITNYEASTGQKLLSVIADPSLAYFLFLIGIALIYFELQAPGGYIAGSAGIGFILLAAVSFQVLPLDWGALGLILLGVVLLILEIFITSFGLLTIFGLIALVMGSLFLFHDESGFISVDYPIIFSTLAGIVLSLGSIAWYLYKDKKKQNLKENFFLPLGETGTVVSKNGHLFQVKVRGEIWNATSTEELTLGDSVEVLNIDKQHLILVVKKSNL
jgi:membrane-bound serine protease (ClpP class)